MDWYILNLSANIWHWWIIDLWVTIIIIDKKPSANVSCQKVIIAIHICFVFVLFSDTAIPKAHNSLIQNVSSKETYLYLDWNALLTTLERKGWQHWQFGHHKYQLIICNTLDKANSVKLTHTLRLLNQVGSFLIKLQACFRNRMLMSLFESRQQCFKQMKKIPPWACKVLESEFGSRSCYFENVCKKNVKRGPHPKWTEFEKDVNFEVALMRAASIKGNDILNNYFIWRPLTICNT